MSWVVFARVALKTSSLLVLAAAATTVWAEVRVPGFTAYLEPKSNGASVLQKSGVTNWRDPALKVLWFGEIRTRGKLNCSLAMRLPVDAVSKLRLTVGGESREATAQGQTHAAVLDFGSFHIAQAGYQRFALESLNLAGQPFGDLDALILDGPAASDAHFNLKARRNAASVHLRYPVPKDAKIEAFYCELIGLDDPVATYYMACGWHRGYFGMQVISETERRIIFSVWDSGTEAIDRNKVDLGNRTTLVAKGDDVNAGDFGNEGTGGHSHLKYAWKTGARQRFIVTASPVGDAHTIYSGFYFHADKEQWVLISSWKAPHEGGWLRGLYSFSENFDGSNGHMRRKALFGNQWLRTSEGNWLEQSRASFSHDQTGKADRLDRFMGMENGWFFLSHGGFVPGFTESGAEFTRPTTGQPPGDITLPTPAAGK
ncbi:MAG: DUF3472 domain-containing protein [Verrucomicrobiales bacterium]